MGRLASVRQTLSRVPFLTSLYGRVFVIFLAHIITGISGGNLGTAWRSAIAALDVGRGASTYFCSNKSVSEHLDGTRYTDSDARYQT